MTCALCRAEAPLQNSHIIPEFLYQALYDEKHRFHRLTTNTDDKNRFLQKGLREPLLCMSCEQQLAKIERYASLVLNGGIGLDYRNDGDKTLISGLDYTTFKLFQMSILWRAGVSTLPEFRQVKLSHHTEVLRARLLNNDPGSPREYGCLMFAVRHEGAIVKDLVIEPTPSRLLDHKCYRFIFGGFAWIYVVSKHRLPNLITDQFLTADGVCVIRMQDVDKMKFLVDTATKMRDSGKLI